MSTGTVELEVFLFNGMVHVSTLWDLARWLVEHGHAVEVTPSELRWYVRQGSLRQLRSVMLGSPQPARYVTTEGLMVR